MLKNLKWASLENKRKISHLILLFKIMRKLLIVPDCCLPIFVPESTHAHNLIKLTHTYVVINMNN